MTTKLRLSAKVRGNVNFLDRVDVQGHNPFEFVLGG
jgi:hypothetical protein